MRHSAMPDKAPISDIASETRAMCDVLVGARKAMLVALPHVPPDGQDYPFVGEWLIEVNEVLGRIYGWANGKPNVPGG